MTRPEGTQTTFGYDGLNRVTSVSTGGLTRRYGRVSPWVIEGLVDC
jgi:YD repeat-containing protein